LSSDEHIVFEAILFGESNMAIHIRKIVPKRVFQSLKKYEEKIELGRIKNLSFDPSFLKNMKEKELVDIFLSPSIEKQWIQERKEIDLLKITDRAHGVNYGDRRALFYLIRHFNPHSVLEVGTHIGASTAHMALALKNNDSDRKKIVSLDIYDVNGLNTRIYSHLGVTHSPLEMLRRIGCEGFVEFITCPSLEYMKTCDSKFDFIFLDGDHSAKTVVRVLVFASRLLNKNGTILLHDYFPGMKPLWSNGYVVFGPYLAVQRFIEEGISIEVIPLGLLPWPTKMNSNRTSLALLTKKD